MRSEASYVKNKVRFIILASLLLWLALTYNIFSSVNRHLFSYDTIRDSNYNKYYNFSLPISSAEEVGDGADNSFNLSEMYYDKSTLYLDYSEINKNRDEREKKELEEYKKKEEEEEAKRAKIWFSKYEELINRVEENNKHVIKPTTSTKIVECSMPLPNIANTSWKGWMCAHKVTSRTSKQLKFLHSGEYPLQADENGILKYGDYYVVAMASYYTKYKVGSTFRITLDSGVVFDVITGDEKADRHTDENNMYRPKGNGVGEIIEFIVACGADGANCSKYGHSIHPLARRTGDFSILGFKGNVAKIEKLDDYSVVNSLYKDGE